MFCVRLASLVIFAGFISGQADAMFVRTSRVGRQGVKPGLPH